MLGRKSVLTDNWPTKQIRYFFMERSLPKVSSLKLTDASVKITDPLASYRFNCNFGLKFYNRLSALRKTLALNR